MTRPQCHCTEAEPSPECAQALLSSAAQLQQLPEEKIVPMQKTVRFQGVDDSVPELQRTHSLPNPAGHKDKWESWQPGLS